MKPLRDSFSKIVDSGASNVNYDKDSLVNSLIKDTKHSKTLFGKIVHFPYFNLSRFFILLTTIVVVVVLVLTFSITYFKDIVFFESNLSVNKEGVFKPSKSCGREYCLFLFNTSELWANTGIYLNKGDKFKISVSGAFHSSVEHLRENAECNNPDTTIMWIGGKKREELSQYMDSVYACVNYEIKCRENACYRAFHRKPAELKSTNKLPQYEKRRYCVDTNAYIGAVLYRIAPEYQLWDPDNKNETIFALNSKSGKSYQKVEKPGVLTMAVNDIYFKDTAMLSNYFREYPARFRSDTKLFIIDSVLDADEGKDNYKRMFYDDNLGQILVCMEIQHPLYWRFFDPLTPFRNIDTKLELVSENTSSRFVVLRRAFWWIVLSILHVSLLFVVYTVVAVMGVYLLFLLGFWFYVFLKKLPNVLGKIRTFDWKFKFNSKNKVQN